MIWIVTLLAVMPVVVATVLSVLQQQQLVRAMLEEEARSSLAGLALAVPEALGSQQTDRLLSTARQIENPSILFVRFYDTQGSLLVDTRFPETPPGAEVDPFGQQLLASPTPLLQWQPSELAAGQAVLNGSQQVGAVSIAISTALLPSTLISTSLRGLLVGLAAATVGVVIALQLSKAITDSLADTADALRRISEEDWSPEVTVTGPAEVAQVLTALQKVPRSLQHKLAREGAIISAVYDGVISVDHQGQIIACNPAVRRMFGYSQQAMLQLRVSQLIQQWSLHKKTRHDLTSYFAIGDGTLFDRLIEAVAVHADGHEFPIEWAVTRISPATPPSFAIIVHNITARKRVEEDLRQAKNAAEAASRAKTAFLTNMSHELRTPLSAILGYAELLHDEARESGQLNLAADLAKVEKSAHHLLSLINTLLDMARVEAGQVELQIESFDIASLVMGVADTSRILAEKNGNLFQLDCSEHIGVMEADRNKVQQILLNLLSNAAKFTRNGTITLSVSRISHQGGEHIRFAVADSGIGIDENHLHKLFQPFIQVSMEITHEYGGSGLGLAISKSFCELMGGQIDVQTEFGKGSTFTVILPSKVVPSSPGSGADPGTGPSPTVADVAQDATVARIRRLRPQDAPQQPRRD